MSENLVVYLNGTRVVEFDRSQGLPGHLRRLLEEMDADMDGGIDLPGGHVAQPDRHDKAHFVIEQLLNTLSKGNNFEAASVLCTYVGTRLPDLVAIRARDQQGAFSVDLQFE